MAENNHKLLVTIGAALGSGFNSVISGSTSKIKKLGSAIKEMEKNSLISASSFQKLKGQYNSLLGSMYRQQSIIQKRGFYRSQIMEVVGLGAALAAPIRSAMKFESAMADVGKVVDFSEPKGLEKMGDSLRELSRSIPLSVDGLAQITAAGGQLGVKEKDLISFTTNVAKMSTAFDILPNEAGESMATLSNVFNIPITQLTNLGDVINHISNNSSAKARAIVPALARAGGAARQFGLTAQNTVALVGTLIAMGKAPEEAGTATAAILQRLQLADKLGPRAESAFRKIGISAKVFGKMVSEDAQGALLKFFNAVSKVQGQERAGVLVNIFGKNYSGTMATLIGSLDKYKDQLQLISDPSKYKGSMEVEYRKRSETTENAFQLLKNAISELSIVLGKSLLPTVKSVITSISDALQKVTSWISANPELTRTITHVVGGLITARIAFFALGYASTFLFGGWNRLVILFKGLRLGIGMLGASFKSFLGWPLALAAGAWLIWENWESVREFFLNIWSGVEPYWNSFKQKMDELGITSVITAAWQPVQTFFANIWENVSPVWNAFIQKIKSLSITQKIISAWESVKNYFKGFFDELTMLWNKFTAPISNLFGGAKNLVSKIGSSLGFGGSKAESSLKLPEMKRMAPEVSREQNNNFVITINAARNDNAESISDKVMKKVSNYSRPFLYDPVPEVL